MIPDNDRSTAPVFEPSPKHVKSAAIVIERCGAGSNTRVQVGQHDITRAVRSLTFQAEVGEVPSLVLGLTISDPATIVADAVAVKVSDDVRALLLEIGWTPPDFEGVARFWVSVDDELLDRDDITWPASWTIAQRVRRISYMPPMSLLEIIDSEAPAEVNGKVCNPIIARNYDSGAATVVSYNPVES